MRFESYQDCHSRSEFNNEFWFTQLLVWLDFMVNPDFFPSCVLETGTHHGAGAYRWSTFFDEVHTVELSEELHSAASLRYADVDNITFHQGTSVDFLTEILPTRKDPCIIFLDAHGSGGDTTFDPTVGRMGSPILAELEAIKTYSLVNNHVIVIDDLDDCSLPLYPNPEDIEAALLDINPNYYVELSAPRHLLMSRGTGLAVADAR